MKDKMNIIDNAVCYDNNRIARMIVSVAATSINCAYDMYDIPAKFSQKYVLRRTHDNVSVYEMYTRIPGSGTIRIALKEFGCDKNRIVIKINKRKELSITLYDIISNDDNKIITNIQTYHKFYIQGVHMPSINDFDHDAVKNWGLSSDGRPVLIDIPTIL